MKKDLTVFIRLGSFGALCVCTLIGFVVVYGTIALLTTDFKYDFAPNV